jgi:hypothetical protein
MNFEFNEELITLAQNYDFFFISSFLKNTKLEYTYVTSSDFKNIRNVRLYEKFIVSYNVFMNNSLSHPGINNNKIISIIYISDRFYPDTYYSFLINEDSNILIKYFKNKAFL